MGVTHGAVGDRIGQQAVQLAGDIGGFGADQFHRACGNSLWPFRGIAHHQHGFAQ
ncbi:hypothetical protein D3C78_1694810 [compost metagenome]